MKSAERVLREWTLDRIRFQAGEVRYQHFTQKGIATIAEHIRTGVTPRTVETVWKRITMVEIPYTGALRSLRIGEVNHFLTKMKALDRVTPIWLARFESLKELHGQITHEAICAGHTLEYWEVWGAEGPPSRRVRRGLKM